MFFSNEGTEPAHIHVQNARKLAKFWLSPVILAASTSFPAHELNRIRGIVEAHQPEILEAWNEYFSS